MFPKYFCNILLVIIISIYLISAFIKDYFRWAHCKVKIEGKVIDIHQKYVGKSKRLHSQPICEYYFNGNKFVNPVGDFSPDTYTINDVLHFKINADDPNETYMPTSGHRMELLYTFIIIVIAIIMLIYLL